MATTWRSNLPAFLRAANQADQNGLRAGAAVLANAVRANLAGGYTSGDFVTGESVERVTVSQVYYEDRGWAIVVGTDLLYNLFWELGHRNVFTRRFERVEKWRPALVDNRFEIRRAYVGSFMSTLQAAGF